MESPGRDEQDMVRAHHAVLGVDRRTFHDGQQVTLHAFARDVGRAVLGRAGDLVDLVDEDDAHLLHALASLVHQSFLIHQFAGFFLDQHVIGLADLHLAAATARREGLAEHVPHLVAHLFHAGDGEHVHALGRLLGHFDFHFAVVHEAKAELLAQFFAGIVAVPAKGIGQQQIQQTGLRGSFGSGPDPDIFLFPHKVDADLHEIAHHGFHIAAHIAHFRELGGLDLDEGSSAQLCQTAGYLGFAHTGGAHHDDVLGSDLITQLLRKMLTTPAVTDSNSDHALGLFLSHHKFIQFCHDFTRCECAHCISCASFDALFSSRPACAGDPTIFSGSHASLYMSMIFPLTMAPLSRTCFFPIVAHAPSPYLPSSSSASGAGLAAAPAGHSRPPPAPAHGGARRLSVMPAGHPDTSGAGSLPSPGPDLVRPGGPRRLVPDAGTGSKRKKTRRQALKRSSLSVASAFQTHRTGLVLPSWLSES